MLQTHGYRWWIGWIFFVSIMSGGGSAWSEPDYVRFYERGKLRLQQKMYFDAVKDLRIATNTGRGKRSFAAHYHLANAFYWLPDIQQAMQIVTKAEALAKNPSQREAIEALKRKIKDYYGVFQITSEVDPEEVGKLQVVIKPKSPFSNAHKRRYFEIFLKRVQRQGGFPLNNKAIFLPKGEYEISIQQNQCLKYGFAQKKELLREITIEEQPTQVALIEKPSCECTGGQKLFREKTRVYCACKAGSAWNPQKARCEIARAANPLPWIFLGAGVLLAGGVITGIVIAVNSREMDNAQAIGEKGKIHLWERKSSTP
jgi:tetratricopeptide (TPR) repeat protein